MTDNGTINGEPQPPPTPDGYAGRYADGETATVHDVRLGLAGDGIHIYDAAGGPMAVWSYDDLRIVEKPVAGRPVRLRNLAQDLARLEIADHAVLGELHGLAPQIHNIGARDPVARKRVAFWIAVMFALFGGGWFTLANSAPVIAAMMPMSMEERMGRTAIEQVTLIFGGWKGSDELTCRDEAGERALEAMTLRLKAVDESEYEFKVRVLDIPIPNAFAAPGGYIVIFDGLLDLAESPDEVAGVLAHEMTHVTHRHATANMVRSIGLQAFIIPLLTGGTMTSDVMTGIGQMAVQASYSRDAEADADKGAVEMMNAAGLKAASFTELLSRIEEKYGIGSDEGGEDAEGDGSLFSIPDMLSTHPSTPDRARLVREAAAPGGEAGLTDEQWSALKSICAATGE
ncbi:MAG: M48 family metallopeptidase [Alphaproteobacteria bacterium]|nr:M48 family metallopeptidase [Alphaproteobacteria bacterium]